MRNSQNGVCLHCRHPESKTFMQNYNLKMESSLEEKSYLPDFCHSETNLKMILALESVAIVLSLASAPDSGDLFITIALISMYVLWIGLSCAGLLCLLRNNPLLKHTVQASVISLLIVFVVTAIMALISFRLKDYFGIDLYPQYSLTSLLIQHEAIALILVSLALRYFYIQFIGQQMIKTQSQARIQALQARIRPHFLFNSLNTIANLTHEDPEKAELAIESLADLFRISLKADTIISLQQEIELARDYITLEQMRLAERLRVNWQVEADLENISLPALTLQPLVENAIYHGIEPQEGGGEINISVLHCKEALSIEITNPLVIKNPARQRKGNHMALDNIRERLELVFNGRAKVEHIIENDLYMVKLRIPVN